MADNEELEEKVDKKKLKEEKKKAKREAGFILLSEGSS